MRCEQDRRWASGAAVALVAAVGGVCTHLALRAESEGAPGTPALVLGVALLALALWPLAARATSVVTLTAVLAAAQFGTHALAVVAAGQGRDPLTLVCCPSTAQVRPGPLGTLTAEAGGLLAVVQLAACLALALAVRGGREAADLFAAAAQLAQSVLATTVAGWRRLVGLLSILLGVAVPTPPTLTWRQEPARVLPQGLVLARRTTRRGPPARRTTSPVLSRADLASLVLPAAG